MILRNFLLADAVDVGPGGKAFIHGGGVSRLFAHRLPWIHPTLGVYATLEGEPDEVGEPQPLELLIVRPDGEPLPARIDTSFALAAPTDSELPASVTMALGMAGVQFPELGLYHVVLRVGDAEIGRVPLLVRPPE